MMTYKEVIKVLEFCVPRNTAERREALNIALETLENAAFYDEPAYWESADPDYDRDGTRIPSRVVICSYCRKPAKLPRTRYCPNCGKKMNLENE